MFFPGLFGGSLLGLLLKRFFDLWNKLDARTKKLIIEQVIKAFEQILRDFYRSYKQKRR